MIPTPCLGARGADQRPGRALLAFALGTIGLALGAPDPTLLLGHSALSPGAYRPGRADETRVASGQDQGAPPQSVVGVADEQTADDPPDKPEAKEKRPEMATPRPRPPRHDPGSTVDRRGEAIFFSRDATPIRIACADCHLVTPPGTSPSDDLIRPGHTVYDAAGRGNWWNGRIMTDSGEAGEVCLKRFMGGEEMSGAMRTRLVEYMMSLAAPYSSPFVIRRMPPGLIETSSGDAEKGQDLYRRACAGCHTDGGAGLGPDLTSSEMTPREIADLIRAGSDPMPFYQADILTDEEVAHVSAFTYGLQAPPAE